MTHTYSVRPFLYCNVPAHLYQKARLRPMAQIAPLGELALQTNAPIQHSQPSERFGMCGAAQRLVCGGLSVNIPFRICDSGVLGRRRV